MEERKLEVLRFSMSKLKAKSGKLSFSSIDGVDLFDNFFHNFVSFIDSFPRDEKHKRIVQFGKDLYGKTIFQRESGNRSISGVIETGKYGKEENVVDVNKKDDEPVFTIHKNHAVPKPFFFFICIPEIKNEGVIILERDGPYGIKALFISLFKKYMQQNFTDVVLRVTNFIDDQIVKHYIKDGAYKNITLTRSSLPEDVAERYGLEKFQSDDFTVELSIKAKGTRRITGKARRRIQELFESNPDGFFASEDFSKLGFDSRAKVKVNSIYRDAPRTINLSDTMKFKPYYDIMVDLNDSGHSDFNSVKSEASLLLNDFNLDLY